MARCRQLVAVAGLLLASWSAHAGYAQAVPPSGFGAATGGGWQYSKAANELWTAAKTVRTTSSLSVGGRVVTMTAAMRMAANAGVYGARALMLNPGWMAAVAVATWVAGELWYENEQWWKHGLPGTSMVVCWKEGTGTLGLGTMPCVPGELQAMVTVIADMKAAQMTAIRGSGKTAVACAGPTYTTVINPTVTDFGINCTAPAPNGLNQNFDGLRGVKQETEVEVPGPPVPASEADFDELGETKGLPADVPNAVPMPVPVEVPILNPTPDPDPMPQPLRVPLGEPQSVPDTDPQRYRQPVSDIVPSPTLLEPWRVDVQPKDIESTDPQGQTDPEIVGDGAAVGTPQEQEALCEQFPDASACKSLGASTTDPVIETNVIPLSITPVSGFGPSTASCPAARQMTLAGGLSLAMPFDLLCDVANGIRPIVIGLAWLSAVLAWLGLSRKGD